MSYTALYRRFRPRTFEGIIGQEHIVRTLKNQIESGRVSHAYLFCGTRGTGKTSTAKIFAKAINCVNLEKGEPCGKCQLCVSMQEGRSVNVIEIDAASNNGVDNIREIREEIKYPPTEGSFKVYIIDEVHMLSMGAFNALLKTLEEPPKHVIFILATTDPQKVPPTIHSRCQRFDFKRITSGQIVSALKGYLSETDVKVQDKALHYIATLADGSMRDSLSILDQAMAFYFNEEITLEKILDIVGAVDNSLFFQLADSILKRDIGQSMDIVESLMENGRDVLQFVSEFTVHLRNLLVTITVDEPEAVMDMSLENIERLAEQSKRVSSEELIFLIHEFSALSLDMKYASNQRILLEVQLIKLCSPQEKSSNESLAARLINLERRIEEGVHVVSGKAMEKDEPVKKTKPVKKRPKALPEDIEKAAKAWEDVCCRLDMVTKSIVCKTKTGYMEDGRLTVICENHAISNLLKNKLDSIKTACDEELGKDFEIKIISQEEFEDWEKMTYGDKSPKAKKEAEADLEFESLMGGYFPETDME